MEFIFFLIKYISRYFVLFGPIIHENFLSYCIFQLAVGKYKSHGCLDITLSPALLPFRAECKLIVLGLPGVQS